MAEIPYVCLYLSYLQGLSPFTDEEIGRIVRAMMSYASTGELPRFDGNERFIWPSLQTQIDRDVEAYLLKCARNKANGAKGGRPPKNQTVIPETERLFEKPKKAKEKEKEKEKESIEADKPPTRQRFSPPTVEDVRAYCEEKGFRLDPDRFVDYYEANGWMAGKNPMRSWQAAVRNWSRRDEATKSGKRSADGIVLAPLEDPYEAAMRGRYHD